MYFAAIILLLFVLPLVSTGVEMVVHPDAASLIGIAGKWFTFWGVGARLSLAGASQIFRPQYTARQILGIEADGANLVVRELGFANLTFGVLGLVSLFMPEWVVPAAFAGGLFYGLAGIGHFASAGRNAKEQTALVTDLAICAVLAVFVVHALL